MRYPCPLGRSRSGPDAGRWRDSRGSRRAVPAACSAARALGGEVCPGMGAALPPPAPAAAGGGEGPSGTCAGRGACPRPTGCGGVLSALLTESPPEERRPGAAGSGPGRRVCPRPAAGPLSAAEPALGPLQGRERRRGLGAGGCSAVQRGASGGKGQFLKS